MDNGELKKIAIESSLDSLYRNSLFSIKSICEYLGIWESYSEEQKEKLKNISHRDSLLNKQFDKFNKGDYDMSFVYGELARQGVDDLFEAILKHKKQITTKDVFVDIGSGCGKVVIHGSLKSNFQTLVGVEVVEQRVLYAKRILQDFSPIDEKKVFFINKDISDFDLSFATVVFVNNLTFPAELNRKIYQKIPKGCHIISTLPFKDCIYLKENLLLNVSWIPQKFLFRYYIK